MTKASDLPPRKNHYLPMFYSRRWAGADGKLVRYDKPFGPVISRKVHPSRVGWKRDLYASPEPQEHQRFLLESKTFKAIDDRAAIALRRLLDRDITALDLEASYWVHFVLSLFHRTPHQMESSKAYAQTMWRAGDPETQTRYAELKAPDDPPTYDEYLRGMADDEIERSFLKILPRLILSERVFRFVHSMDWLRISLPPDAHSLLLSDQPIARSNGIAKPEGHLAMPLDPSTLLIMAWHPDTKRYFQTASPYELCTAMNRWTVESARNFVVAKDESQKKFIENRFGTFLKPTLLNSS